MTPQFLQAVLRSLAESGPPVGDRELLARFVAQRSESAFAELVRRHGRLVWTVCRQLSDSEAAADDAFQATFLVLLQNAAKVRDGSRLSAWLYGVAYKVCAKARQQTQRRRQRERLHAAPEGNGGAVTESAWDRALASVHEEAAQLVDNLRLPFVLCCLEGKSVTETARQLGWKVGTVSARLKRAKEIVLARLDAQGLTLGAVAGVGLALPPATALAHAIALARSGIVVPSAILQLTQGVIAMNLKSFKVLAATVALTCGLGIGVGGWMTTAAGQAPTVKKVQSQPDPPAEAADPQAEVLRLRSELAEALQAMQQAAKSQADLAALRHLAAVRTEPFVVKTSKWEYNFVAPRDLKPAEFGAMLDEREKTGWQFQGTTTLLDGDKPAPRWVFRRPVILTTGATAEYRSLWALRAIEEASGLVLPKDQLPLEPGASAEMLAKLIRHRFPGRVVRFESSANGLTVHGDQEVRQYIRSIIQAINDAGPKK